MSKISTEAELKSYIDQTINNGETKGAVNYNGVNIMFSKAELSDVVFIHENFYDTKGELLGVCFSDDIDSAVAGKTFDEVIQNTFESRENGQFKDLVEQCCEDR